MISKLHFAVLGTLILTSNAAALETAPYTYNPKQSKCLNGAGQVGMRPNFKGSCGDLWGAELEGQNLSRADLSGANLSRANLKGADLKGSNLKGATMLLTRVDCDLLEGARYNERTVLPFSAKKAQEECGMIYEPTSDKAIRAHQLKLLKTSKQ